MLSSDCFSVLCILSLSPELALQLWQVGEGFVISSPGCPAPTKGPLGLASLVCPCGGSALTPGSQRQGPASPRSREPRWGPSLLLGVARTHAQHSTLQVQTAAGRDADQAERTAKLVKSTCLLGMSESPERFPHSFWQQWFLNPECQSSRKHTVSSISSHSSQKF